MRIGVLGINHKLADLQLRELLAKACQRRFSAGNSLHLRHSFILLSTCNRTEVYFSSDDLADSHSYLLTILRQEVEQDFDQKLYSFFGIDCFLHLCRVTAGLDSAIVAETEIQRQVKAAYENTSLFLTLPSELHYLFQKSLKISKQVRTQLPIKPGLPDIEHAILNTGLELFEKAPSDIKILFVGASDINIKILRFLKAKHYANIAICNRTLDRAKALAAHHELDILDWCQLHSWPNYDWVIFGTKSPETLIHPQDLLKSAAEPKLLIDLSVPRNVHPLLENSENITLLNIDQINRSLQTRHHTFTQTLFQAEQIITHATKTHLQLFYRKTQVRRNAECLVG
ncbi:MAG: glutamyl-tRNA reductase [Parachlamydia sp.]|nr:glutamyl-tRNA reductase [Parachlamydia sp.]